MLMLYDLYKMNKKFSSNRLSFILHVHKSGDKLFNENLSKIMHDFSIAEIYQMSMSENYIFHL